MKAIVIGIALLLAATSAAAKKKSLDLDELRSRGYEGVHGHVNHNQRLDYQLSSGISLTLVGHIAGAAESTRQGHIVRETHGIDDPTVEVAAAIADAIGNRLQLPVTRSRNAEFRSVFAGVAGLQGEAELVAGVGPGKLIVNVGSNAWSVYRRGKERYWVFYGVLAEVVDSSQGKVLWKGDCLFPSPLPKKDQLPISATILDDDAESLKGEFAKARDFCVQRLWSGMSGETAVDAPAAAAAEPAPSPSA